MAAVDLGPLKHQATLINSTFIFTIIIALFQYSTTISIFFKRSQTIDSVTYNVASKNFSNKEMAYSILYLLKPYKSVPKYKILYNTIG